MNDEIGGDNGGMSKMERLVAWNTEILCGLLKQILAARQSKPDRNLRKAEKSLVQGETVLEEFKEII